MAGLGRGGSGSDVAADSALAQAGMDWGAALQSAAGLAAVARAQEQLASDWERWARSQGAPAAVAESSSDAAHSCVLSRQGEADRGVSWGECAHARSLPPPLSLPCASSAAEDVDVSARRAWAEHVWPLFHPSLLLCGAGGWDAPPQRSGAKEEAEEAGGTTQSAGVPQFRVEVASAPATRGGKTVTEYSVAVKQSSACRDPNKARLGSDPRSFTSPSLPRPAPSVAHSAQVL